MEIRPASVPAMLPQAPTGSRDVTHAASSMAADGLNKTSRARLLTGLAAYARDPSKLPAYLGGSHRDWTERTDHCYSFIFRVAIEQGLITDGAARQLIARVPVADSTGFRQVMFPDGFTELPIHIDGDHVTIAAGVIPAGDLVSLDGGDHVMVSTGRLLPGGRHEVYSFKGGGPETPVWGDPVGYDPSPRLHVLSLEDELENLLRDDQPLDQVRAVAGRSPLTP